MVVPTRHAVERFQQRVAPVTSFEAAKRIQEAASTAQVRPTPRSWTPVAPRPGTVFLYPATLPGVCFLARDNAVVTVLVRAQCRSWQAEERAYGGGRNRPQTRRNHSSRRRAA